MAVEAFEDLRQSVLDGIRALNASIDESATLHLLRTGMRDRVKEVQQDMRPTVRRHIDSMTLEDLRLFADSESDSDDNINTRLGNFHVGDDEDSRPIKQSRSSQVSAVRQPLASTASKTPSRPETNSQSDCGPSPTKKQPEPVFQFLPSVSSPATRLQKRYSMHSKTALRKVKVPESLHIRPLPARVESAAKEPLPSTDTLFRRCLSRISLYSRSDMSDIFHCLGTSRQRKGDQRNRTTDNSPLTAWCLLARLDRRDLVREHSDSADVVDELEDLFPELLSILRYPSWEKNDHMDILQIRLKCYVEHPTVLKFGSVTFRAWLDGIISLLPVQGVSMVVSGDIDIFWGDFKPEGYSNDPVVQCPSFPWVSLAANTSAFLSSNHSTSLLGATAGRTVLTLHQGLTPDGNKAICQLCVSCKALITEIAAEKTPGGTFCCTPCYKRLFDICHACTEPIHKQLAITVTCGHKYCTDCLIHCFRSGMISIHEFPPRCCDKELPLREYRKILPNDVITRYCGLVEERERRKEIECATPSCERRTIKPCNIEDEWGLCSKCGDLTCSRCEKLEADHEDFEAGEARKCPRTEDDELNDLAKSNNWRNCPRCNAMVSRSEGCNDMRCRCGQKFCITCGTVYEGRRTCSCPMTFEGGRAPAPLPPAHLPLPEPNPEAVLNCEHQHVVNLGPTVNPILRCHGCLNLHREARACVACRSLFCHQCFPARAGPAEDV